MTNKTTSVMTTVGTMFTCCIQHKSSKSTYDLYTGQWFQTTCELDFKGVTYTQSDLYASIYGICHCKDASTCPDKEASCMFATWDSQCCFMVKVSTIIVNYKVTTVSWPCCQLCHELRWTIANHTQDSVINVYNVTVNQVWREFGQAP